MRTSISNFVIIDTDRGDAVPRKHLRRKLRTFQEKTKEAISYEEPRVKELTIFLLIDQFKTRRERVNLALY